MSQSRYFGRTLPIVLALIVSIPLIIFAVLFFRTRSEAHLVKAFQPYNVQVDMKSHAGINSGQLPHSVVDGIMLDLKHFPTDPVDGKVVLDQPFIDLLLQCGHLKELSLAGSSLSTDALLQLPNLDQLRVIQVGRTNVDDRLLEAIEGSQTIESLGVDSTQVTPDGVQRIATLPNLRRLQIGGPNVTSACLKDLTGLKSLEALHLYNCQVDPQDLVALQEMNVLFLSVSMKPSDVPVDILGPTSLQQISIIWDGRWDEQDRANRDALTRSGSGRQVQILPSFH
ncbi:hypothetical protein AB1L30_14085 [Bremerella sp. JC817]|uniref:hypothetical protein n=1 Tax=Bremerella sp. JC817 TaxID=3231756 RepID=UPI00345AE93E